jgi:pimeloyl-ACP methyl ester carboxylesterase
MTGPHGTIPAHFLVIVPGYMGSKLRDRTTGRTVWVDFASIPKNPLQWGAWLDGMLQAMRYPNPDLEPAGIMDEVVFIPPWAKQEQYSRLIQALEGMGYRADEKRYAAEERDLYAFAYDWRQDNRISARQLGEAIESWRAHHPGAEAWLIAHSNGGLVARWYVEKEGGRDRVGRLFLMGSPWDGVPKAMHMAFSGLDTLFRRGFNLWNLPQRSRDLIRTWPSVYQLIPHQEPFLQNALNEPLDPFRDLNWLASDEQRQLLLQGRRFNEELGTTLSVETLCFFGRKKPTTTRGVARLAGSVWSGIDWLATEAGDGTVPEHSAVHPYAQEKLPFVVSHGDIYVNPAVLEFLQWELIGKYGPHKRAALTTPDLYVLFEPDRDNYTPGERIALGAQIMGREDQAGRRRPMEQATIEVRLLWKEPLPGSEPPQARPRAARTELTQTAEPGHYSGQLRAPGQEGYYEVAATVRVPGQPSVQLSELVLVEEEAQ